MGAGVTGVALTQATMPSAAIGASAKRPNAYWWVYMAAGGATRVPRRSALSARIPPRRTLVSDDESSSLRGSSFGTLGEVAPDDLHRARDAVLGEQRGLHAARGLGVARLGEQAPDALGQARRRELVLGERRRADAELLDALAPVGLVREEGHDERRLAGAQPRRRRPDAAVVHDGGDAREEPVVRHVVDTVHVRRERLPVDRSEERRVGKECRS